MVRKLKKDFDEVLVVTAPGYGLPGLTRESRARRPALSSGVHCGLQASTTEICFCKFVGRAFSDVRLMRFLPIRLGDAVVALAGPAATAPSR